ncbi:hypothetical protein [Pedobacter steynii]|nr:hypothetical protein [Pedobacter steynii]
MKYVILITMGKQPNRKNQKWITTPAKTIRSLLKETVFANDEALQDDADDVLDLITRWCPPEFRVRE